MATMMCDCCDSETTRSVMESRHGILDRFRVHVFAAVPSMISVDEANAGIERYRRQLANAPTEDPRHD